MHFAVAFVALVGLVQAVAWLGGSRATTVQQRIAIVLAPLALIGLALSLVDWRVGGLFR